MANGIGRWVEGKGAILFARWAVYGFFCVIGIMFFSLHVAFGDSFPRLGNIACGFGIAFIVGGVTGLIHVFYLQKELRGARRDQEMEELGMQMHRNGLSRIFPQRPLTEMRVAIEGATKEIRIVGSTLRGLVGTEEPKPEEDAIMRALLEKVKRRIALKLLLAHPIVAGYREEMEGRKKGQIPVEMVKNLVRLVVKLEEVSEEQGVLWEIRLYMCGPSVFSLEVDNRVLFLEPYPLAGTSMDNFCILCYIPNELHNNVRRFLDAHFDGAWAMPTPVPVTRITRLAELGSIVKELTESKCITGEQSEELERLLEQ